jgi:UDP-MurNAc hydroxylase
MTSSITSLGHSGLDIRLGSARLVCDPWLSENGAYLGSWHPFPAPLGRGPVDPGLLHDTPNLYLSSPHPDRLDVETLAGFPRGVRVIVPALPSRALVDRLAGLGFSNVVELEDGRTLDLGGDAKLELVTGAAKHLLAATLVLESAGEVLVHQSDGALDGDTRARLAARRPLFHFLPFSGSSFTPAVYELPPAEMQAHVAREVAALLERFVAVATEVGARFVVPTLPPALLDDDGFELNFGASIYYDVDELVARTAAVAPALADRLRPLHPGDVARRTPEGWTMEGWTMEGWKTPPDDKRRQLEELRRAREPARQRQLAALYALAQPVDTKELRAYLRDMFQFEDMTSAIKMLIEFRIADGPSVWVDFRKRPVRFLGECDEPAGYRVTVEAADLSLVMQGKLTWRELLMARRVKLRGDGDPHCLPLLQHLDYRHDEPLFDFVRRLDPPLITLDDGEMEYVCQRFCPHRGRDLEYATIERGKLTCTAHGWRFDLRNGGKCLWGGETPLIVKSVRPLPR